MFQKVFFWFWWFLYQFAPELSSCEFVFCSTAVRSEWLAVSCVSSVSDFELWFLCFCFHHGGVLCFIWLKKSILKPVSCTSRALTGKAFMHFSPVSVWSCPMGFLNPYVEMAQIMQSLSFLFTALHLPFIMSSPFSFSFLPEPVWWKKERFRSRNSGF